MKNSNFLSTISLSISLVVFLSMTSRAQESSLGLFDYSVYKNTPAWDLAQAVRDNDVLKIKEIVRVSPELLNYQEPQFGYSLLMSTVILKQYETFKVLLDLGSNVNLHDFERGTSALIMACYFSSVDLKYVRKLIAAGAAINDSEDASKVSGNGDQLTPLLAASAHELRKVRYILRKGGDIHFRNESGSTAFTIAVVSDPRVALYLLKQGSEFQTPILMRRISNRSDQQGDLRPVYIAEYLRGLTYSMHSTNFRYKRALVRSLEHKGVNYRTEPIPDAVLEMAKRKYPKTWKRYLRRY